MRRCDVSNPFLRLFPSQGRGYSSGCGGTSPATDCGWFYKGANSMKIELGTTGSS